MLTLDQLGYNAKQASRSLAAASTAQKNRTLLAMADSLTAHSADILAANAADLEAAVSSGMTVSLQDRLRLTEQRIQGMAKGVIETASLPDPVGQIISGGVGTQGLNIRKIRVPLGVVGIICEARPNVTSDAAALCLKSGNALILRSGKEAINSNKAIMAALREAIEASGLPADCAALVEDTSRDSAVGLMKLNEWLDVLIPRGGAGLISAVVRNATVPVIETGTGNCHCFVDSSADIDMAADIVYNAKTSRPSVCNALETLLVHRDIAEKALPAIYRRLREKNVELRCCPETLKILSGLDGVVPATDEDYATEFLDYILACRVVDDIEQAIEHINKYSTGHSECIVTSDYNNAALFTQRVDSAAVYVNASTRFTDGGVFGLGAEIGISTQKLHARGPMGLAELTSMKYIIEGSGQIRE